MSRRWSSPSTRDTLARLAAAVEQVGPVALLHGGLDRTARTEAQRRFRRGEARFLLATDTAGQGLNLHERCRLVISVELPWNPLRLEQRIGRVDRLGQTRRVHATHLAAADSPEELVLASLKARLGRVGREVGLAGDPLGPSCAERSPDERQQGASLAVVRLDLADAARRECDRLSAIRDAPVIHRAPATPSPALRGGHARGHEGRPLLAVVPRRRLLMHAADLAAVPPGGIVAIYSYRIVGPSGLLVEEDQVALHLAAFVAGRPTRREACRHAERLLEVTRESLARAASAEVAARCRLVSEQLSDGFARLRERERALLVSIEDLAARRHRPVQAGLFDRRALRAAAAGRDEADRLLAEMAAGCDDATGDCVVAEAGPELVLVAVLSE